MESGRKRVRITRGSGNLPPTTRVSLLCLVCALLGGHALPSLPSYQLQCLSSLRRSPWALRCQHFLGLSPSQHFAPLWPRAWHRGRPQLLLLMTEKQRIVLSILEMKLKLEGHFRMFSHISSWLSPLRPSPGHSPYSRRREGFPRLGKGLPSLQGWSWRVGVGIRHETPCVWAPPTASCAPLGRHLPSLNLSKVSKYH